MPYMDIHQKLSLASCYVHHFIPISSHELALGWLEIDLGSLSTTDILISELCTVVYRAIKITSQWYFQDVS